MYWKFPCARCGPAIVKMAQGSKNGMRGENMRTQEETAKERGQNGDMSSFGPIFCTAVLYR